MRAAQSILALVVVLSECQQNGESHGSADKLDRRAEELAEQVANVLPGGWRQIGAGVDSAPRRWSGDTVAVTVLFQHDSLTFFGDHTSAACLQLRRTPVAYSGTLLPSPTDQPGGAWVLGTSRTHRWSIDGLLPEDEHWGAVRVALLKRFGITPPE